MAVNEQITALHKQAYDIARNEIIRIVRHILKTYKTPRTFRMAMGTYSFYDKSDERLDHKPCFYRRLNEFTDKWDDIFGLTGDPLKIDKDLSVDKTY